MPWLRVRLSVVAEFRLFFARNLSVISLGWRDEYDTEPWSLLNKQAGKQQQQMGSVAILREKRRRRRTNKRLVELVRRQELTPSQVEDGRSGGWTGSWFPFESRLMVGRLGEKERLSCRVGFGLARNQPAETERKRRPGIDGRTCSDWVPGLRIGWEGGKGKKWKGNVGRRLSKRRRANVVVGSSVDRVPQ
ncbi:hypothetical protein BDP81DRAFT_426488 [Colletotrichum phormii]|uniref:Uncharacterized protein n=1 Tax=Colletotrichum phormii TaxID=359342 RepID=A0AAI9ZU64_9PEZI|nr:uncharacterized protein BDP81DRAFT_426488 [Colletotrichum phormii]KAK1637023.1 hypothetical protein BDP81DRAFT_426488 [Colletotrichum phormii]